VSALMASILEFSSWHDGTYCLSHNILLLYCSLQREEKIAEELYRLTTEARPKFLHCLEQPDHVITIGLEGERVFELTKEFVEAIVSGAAETALPGDAQKAEVDGSPLDR
jgi:hypothetical protein